MCRYVYVRVSANTVYVRTAGKCERCLGRQMG